MNLIESTPVLDSEDVMEYVDTIKLNELKKRFENSNKMLKWAGTDKSDDFMGVELVSRTAPTPCGCIECCYRRYLEVTP